MNTTEAMSLTHYLGRLRAFVDALNAEAATIATYVRRLEGQDREQAFGWESILDRSRARAELVIEHWLQFNQHLDGRVYPDDLELRVYGEHHKLRYSFAETCPRALEVLHRINRYIDTVARFERPDVKLISALVGEMISLLRDEAGAAREVGLRLMVTAAEAPADESGAEDDPAPYPGMSFNQATAYLEDYLHGRRSFDEELGPKEAA